ncbi:MAG: glycosyltransferase family 2 protein [Deltaproteobacteria bacterium]|nr:glycosyltransferase family 2 protein [Deltaproteobacteria bacterium]
MSLAVVIPVYNGGENFRRCLTSLAAAVPPPQEIIVVADGDTDDSWRLALEFGAQVVKLATRGGPAQARNVGARAAQSELLLFVDADITVPIDIVSQIVTVFAREPELSALFGSYDDEPAAPNFLSQYKNLFHHYVHQTARADAGTFWGACGAIRREVFLTLGGFYEKYRRPSIEDIEFGYRLRQAGKQIRLCKTLQVKHLKHWGIVSLLKTDFYYRALPWTELILRERRVPNDLNLQLSSRLSAGLTYGLLVAGVSGGWWPGAFVAAGMIVFLLLALNAPLYRFFWRKRGLWFAVRTVPWHWLYYFYSGLAFAIGVVFAMCRSQSPLNTKAGAVVGGPSSSGKYLR